MVVQFITYSTLNLDVQYERCIHGMSCVAQFMNKFLWKKILVSEISVRKKIKTSLILNLEFLGELRSGNQC